MYHTKITRLFWWILGLTIALAIAVVVFIACDQTNDMAGNLMSEGLGVGLELLIVIGYIERLQQKNKKQEQVNIEHRIRKYLIFFLEHGLTDLYEEFFKKPFYVKNHNSNQLQLDNFISCIKKNPLNCAQRAELRKHCKRDISAFNNLLPVASQLSKEHFKCWSNIIYYLHLIIEEEGCVDTYVIAILGQIKKFDVASFEKKLENSKV